MNDIEVSSIDLVEGGNVFKQGHYLTLGYVPRDEKGETVDLSGKTLNVALWGRKGVVFEAVATYSGGVIRFTLDKVVAAGDYTVEFTATSSTDSKYRKKFPTNQHSGRIAIKQSADDLGVVGIQVYTVAQLKAEQKLIQDQYESALNEKVQVTDAKSSNALARATFAETTATGVKNQFDQIIISGDSSVEAAAARVAPDETFVTLKDRLDSKEQLTVARFEKTEEQTNRIGNADMPLTIPTYDGSNQSVHPDGLYFSTPWNGYRYWMVSTPYPWTNDFHENPSITASVDGIEWVVPDGLTNPLDSVTTAESAAKIHLSDGVLVYRQDTDTLECWYRWTDEANRIDKFYRRTTKNGRTWTDKELVYQPSGLFVSPSVSFENGKYRMWGVPLSTYEVNYLESSNPTVSWSDPVVVPVTYAPGETSGQMWHLDVYKEGSLYHLIWSEKTGSIYWSTSTNSGMSFSNTRKILSPSTGAGRWDNNHLYRASLLKVGNLYRLYYSALGSSPGRWYIGLTEGENLLALKGSSNITNYARKNIHRVFGESAAYTTIETERGIIRVPAGKESWLRLIDTNRAGAGLKVGDSTGMLKVVQDNGTNLGDLHVVTLKVTNLRPNSTAGGVNAEGLLRVINVGPELPRFKLLNAGVSGAGLALDSKDTLKVIADNESVNGHFKAASVILNGASKNTTGEIRYNETLAKFQGLASGYWYDLNNYRTTPPTANISPGSTGDYAVDADYLYVCYQAGRWNRFAKTAW